ncbi:sigma-70 family RNA polymerase sigma factor [Anaerosacchariphilus polymeriproducens]|uniref:Sigma-70 family RNA polymerase sigma factor n=2 Tax=Anaerosacchariphilus polymeriproducens TaxID=1812858 RepID=A0A371AVV8_9FIRM|nr:sigma-70 family RNA polymerase sigma factor [Anaerosacchariphilus polymeriproducens]
MEPDEVIEKYADMVYRLAIVECKNRVDADDIFQEVFIRLVKHLHKLKTEEHIKAWLIRVTLNCAKKHFTSYWSKNVTSIEDENQIEGSQTDKYEIEKEDSQVYKAVRDLPPKYKEIVHLFYFEELSILEISKLLKKKESTVKSQLFRARELLRKKLEGEF